MTEFHYGELIDPIIENISLNLEVNDTEVKSPGKIFVVLAQITVTTNKAINCVTKA